MNLNLKIKPELKMKSDIMFKVFFTRKENPDMAQIINHWLSFIDMERSDLLEMASKKNEKIKNSLKPLILWQKLGII